MRNLRINAAIYLKAPHYWADCVNPLGKKLIAEKGGEVKEYFFPAYPMGDNFGPNREEFYRNQIKTYAENLAITLKQAIEDFK